jgi:hypothetical protein
MHKNDILDAYFSKARTEDVDMSLEDIQSIVDKNIPTHIPAESVVNHSIIKQIIFNTKYTLWSLGVVSTVVTSIALWSFNESEGAELQEEKLIVNIDESVLVEEEYKEEEEVIKVEESHLLSLDTGIAPNTDVKLDEKRVDLTDKTSLLYREEKMPEILEKPILSKESDKSEASLSVEETSNSTNANEILFAETDLKIDCTFDNEEQEQSAKGTEEQDVNKIDSYTKAREVELEKNRLRNQKARTEIRGFEVIREFKFMRFRQKVYLKNSENKRVYNEISLLVYNNDRWAKVYKKQKCGFIDETGCEVVKVKYDRIFQYGTYWQDWAKIQSNEKFGFLDREGEEVVSPMYDKIFFFDVYKTGWAMVKKDGKYGFIDETGKEVVKPQYSKISYFGEKHEKWAEVEINGLHGFIDEAGMEQVEPQYNRIFFYDAHHANWAMVKKDKLYGFIDNLGKELVKPIYDKIFYFDEYRSNWAMVMKDGQYGFINTEAQEVVQTKYDKIFHFDVHKENWAKVKLDKKYGFIDIEGNELVKPEYKVVGFENSNSDKTIELQGEEGSIRVNSEGEKVLESK